MKYELSIIENSYLVSPHINPQRVRDSPVCFTIDMTVPSTNDAIAEQQNGMID